MKTIFLKSGHSSNSSSFLIHHSPFPFNLSRGCEDGSNVSFPLSFLGDCEDSSNASLLTPALSNLYISYFLNLAKEFSDLQNVQKTQLSPLTIHFSIVSHTYIYPSPYCFLSYGSLEFKSLFFFPYHKVEYQGLDLNLFSFSLCF